MFLAGDWFRCGRRTRCVDMHGRTRCKAHGGTRPAEQTLTGQPTNTGEQP